MKFKVENYIISNNYIFETNRYSIYMFMSFSLDIQ